MVFHMCKFREWEWEGPCGNGRDWEYRKPFPHISTMMYTVSTTIRDSNQTVARSFLSCFFFVLLLWTCVIL